MSLPCEDHPTQASLQEHHGSTTTMVQYVVDKQPAGGHLKSKHHTTVYKTNWHGGIINSLSTG